MIGANGKATRINAVGRSVSNERKGGIANFTN